MFNNATNFNQSLNKWNINTQLSSNECFHRYPRIFLDAQKFNQKKKWTWYYEHFNKKGINCGLNFLERNLVYSSTL